MPYRETEPDTLALWPHRSLSRHGFVWFIGLTAGFLALPLATQLGTAVLWGLLPFMAAVVAGIWAALRASYRTDKEELTLTPEEIRLVRHSPGQASREWRANPYWVRPELHPRGGPVPDYLTLSGGGRVVELGAFLTAEERRALHDHLQARLNQMRQSAPPP